MEATCRCKHMYDIPRPVLSSLLSSPNREHVNCFRAPIISHHHPQHDLRGVRVAYFCIMCTAAATSTRSRSIRVAYTVYEYPRCFVCNTPSCHEEGSRGSPNMQTYGIHIRYAVARGAVRAPCFAHHGKWLAAGVPCFRVRHQQILKRAMHATSASRRLCTHTAQKKKQEVFTSEIDRSCSQVSAIGLHSIYPQ